MFCSASLDDRSRLWLSFNHPEPFECEKDYILGHYEVKKSIDIGILSPHDRAKGQ